MQLFHQSDPAALVDAMRLEHALRQVEPNHCDLHRNAPTRLTSRVQLTPQWSQTLGTIENTPYRQGVKRLAHYCSAVGLTPGEVRSEHLVGLHDALEAECMTKH